MPVSEAEVLLFPRIRSRASAPYPETEQTLCIFCVFSVSWVEFPLYLLPCRLLKPYEEISSGNPSMSKSVTGLSLLILRQRWHCMLYDVYGQLVGCCVMGSKCLEYIFNIRTENTLNSQTLNNRTKALNQTKH